MLPKSFFAYDHHPLTDAKIRKFVYPALIFLYKIIIHQHTFMIVWGIVEINDDILSIELENVCLINIILSYLNLFPDINYEILLTIEG
jgi:hypothetical protein